MIIECSHHLDQSNVNAHLLRYMYYNLLRYSKTCLKRPLKKEHQKLSSILTIPYCRSKVLQNAILLTSIKLPFSIKTLVLSIFKWSLKTGFTLYIYINITKMGVYPECIHHSYCPASQELQCLHILFTKLSETYNR